MKIKVEIKCNGCGKVAYKWRNPKAKTRLGRCFHFPRGWSVAVPSGWLCPECCKSRQGE